MDELERLSGVWVTDRSRMLWVIVLAEHDNKRVAAWGGIGLVDVVYYEPYGEDEFSDEALGEVVRWAVLRPPRPSPAKVPYVSSCGLLEVLTEAGENLMVTTYMIHGQALEAKADSRPYRLEQDKLIVLPIPGDSRWCYPEWIYQRRQPTCT
jgi:hypothetical protein